MNLIQNPETSRLLAGLFPWMKKHEFSRAARDLVRDALLTTSSIDALSEPELSIVNAFLGR